MPMWVRHPRLEGILGVRLAEVTWTQVEELVSQKVAEDLSMDFKQSHYILDRASGQAAMPTAHWKAIEKRMAKDRQELVKDVTAFANASGGIIVIGISDSNGRADRITTVALEDGRRLTYLDTLRNWTAPYLTGIEIGHLSSPTNTGEGCVLIYVPASADSPHAVVEPNTHRHTWFARDGAHAPTLSEAQVAVAYRDRYAARGDVERKVHGSYNQGVAELNRENTTWLAVAAVPARGATRRHLERRVLDEFKAQTEKRQDALPGGFLGHHATYGRSRIVLRDNHPDSTAASDHLLHLGLDGSAFAAVALDTLQDTSAVRHRRPELEDDVKAIRVGSLTTWVLTLTGIVAGHAVDAGGSGDLELVCGIITATEANWVSLETAPPLVQHVVLDTPWRHSPSEDMIAGTTWRDTLTPVQLSTTAAVASDARELIALGAQLVSELVAEFGHLPNEPLLNTDGFVIGDHCQNRLVEGLRGWAEWRNLLAEQQ